MASASLLRIAVLACSLGASVGSAEGRRVCSCDPVIVGAAYPTNGQEVLADLSDPGPGGELRAMLNGSPDRRARRRIKAALADSPLDPEGPIALSSAGGAMEPWTAHFDPVAKTFLIRPTLPLPPDQYTLKLDGGLWQSRRDRRRGWPGYDFITSFTVGPDIHPPRVMAMSHGTGLVALPLREPVRLEFNESLDPHSVFGGTVFVEDVGVVPPVAVPGRLSLQRDAFHLVFTPETGFPPGTTVRIRVAGGSAPDVVRDRGGNALAEDFLLQFSIEDE